MYLQVLCLIQNFIHAGILLKSYCQHSQAPPALLTFEAGWQYNNNWRYFRCNIHPPHKKNVLDKFSTAPSALLVLRASRVGARHESGGGGGAGEVAERLRVSGQGRVQVAAGLQGLEHLHANVQGGGGVVRHTLPKPWCVRITIFVGGEGGGWV